MLRHVPQKNFNSTKGKSSCVRGLSRLYPCTCNECLAFRSGNQGLPVSSKIKALNSHFLGFSALKFLPAGNILQHIESVLVVLEQNVDKFLRSKVSQKQQLWIIKVLLPTDADEKCFKRSVKIYIKIAPTHFGVITIITERTIWALLKLRLLKQPVKKLRCSFSETTALNFQSFITNRCIREML